MMERSLRCNAVHVASLLGAFATGASWTRALGLLKSSTGIAAVHGASLSGPVAKNSAIKASENPKAWPFSLTLLRSLRCDEQLADVVSYNSAIDGCAAGNCWQVACNLYEEIRLLSPSCAPTLVSGALRKPPAAYYKCMAGGPPVAGIQEDRVRAMVVLGAVTYNAAMNACLHSTKERRGVPTEEDETAASKEISWRRSLNLRMELGQASVAPDLVSVNLALACYAAGRGWREALSYGEGTGILGPDTGQGQRPDEVTFGALLGARFPRDLAMNLLQAMREEDLEPNAVTHSAVISACERDGNPLGAPSSLWGLGGTDAFRRLSGAAPTARADL
ncbi:EMB2654 [Symbiodinium natans]|uniref:EMB2654 protein n=1 Tax=Symbiodinium natans TaxID=878477 RepID=A0A812IIA8_9DINO|nr:EMB2654 [Symbiodinium natans]